MQIKQRITPFLTFKDQAQEAAEFYVSVFPDAKLGRTTLHPNTQAVLTVKFELLGMEFVSLNAGQDWKFTEATSFAVACDTQAELDRLWNALSSDGGREVSCGWLQDRFGMFWQIVPSQLNDWLESNNPEKLGNMFEAVWQMTKLDIAQLQAAFDGESA